MTASHPPVAQPHQKSIMNSKAVRNWRCKRSRSAVEIGGKFQGNFGYRFLFLARAAAWLAFVKPTCGAF
jgi:hypothetical protein